MNNSCEMLYLVGYQRYALFVNKMLILLFIKSYN